MSILTRGLCGVAAHFDGGSFWVAIRVDISDPSDAFIELTHQARDDREGNRTVTDCVRLTGSCRSTAGSAGGFSAPNWQQDHKALPAEWRPAFLGTAKPIGSGTPLSESDTADGQTPEVAFTAN